MKNLDKTFAWDFLLMKTSELSLQSSVNIKLYFKLHYATATPKINFCHLRRIKIADFIGVLHSARPKIKIVYSLSTPITPNTNSRATPWRLLHHANKRHSAVMATSPMSTPHTPSEGSRWHTLDIRMNISVWK